MKKTTAEPPMEVRSGEDMFLSRKALCARWDVSVDFVRSQEAAGRLHPVRLSHRCLRYRLREIETLERTMTDT